MEKGKIRLTLLHDSHKYVWGIFVLLSGLSILTFYQLLLGSFPKIPIFLISELIIIEIFIKLGIGKISPNLSISQNFENVYDSFTKQATLSILFKKNTHQFISFLTKFPSSKFFLEKAVISRKEVFSVNVSKELLSKKAFEIAKRLNGNFVTTSDLLSAYLILTESKTKLLFNHKLKEEDILNIAAWARIVSGEENPRELKAKFVGIGIFEPLVYGWTPEARKYTRDLTFSEIKKSPLIAGREEQYNILIESMQKEENNNVLLVGDIGVGKSNLVENFIFESYEASLPKKLNHRRFLEVMVGPLVAGSTDRGILETRLQSIIEEVEHSGNIVLYIPEFQNLLGSSTYNIDLSGAILPYLKDGKMPIIASMTPVEYKKYFEESALREVFETIILEEPDSQTSLKMLFKKTEEIERENKIKLSYKSVLAAVEFSKKYNPSSVLPGSAVDLLNDSANSVLLSRGKKQILLEEDVFTKVVQKSHIPVGLPRDSEKQILLNLEREMHESIIGQDQAVSAIAEAIRRVRSGIVNEKPISFLFLGPTGVGKTQTAKTLANIYFRGETHIIRLDMSEYANPDGLDRILQSGAKTFIEDVYTHPFSIVLLDEFEKADKKILNLFLQVLDEGRLTDDQGRTVSFVSTIIIATSNAGSEFIRQSLLSNTPMDSRTLLDHLQKNNIFRPELLNRFDDIVVFKPLTQGEITQITNLLLIDLIQRIAKQDIALNFDPAAVEKIAKGGFNEEFGARHLKRFIQDNIEDDIAEKILSGKIKRGDKLFVTLNSVGNLNFFKAS